MHIYDDLVYEILNYLDPYDIEKFSNVYNINWKYLFQKHYNLTISDDAQEKIILYDTILSKLNNITDITLDYTGILLIVMHDVYRDRIIPIIQKFSNLIYTPEDNILYISIKFKDKYSWYLYRSWHSSNIIGRGKYSMISSPEKTIYNYKELYLGISKYYNSIKLIFDTIKNYRINVDFLDRGTCDTLIVLCGKNIPYILQNDLHKDINIKYEYLSFKPTLYISFKNKFFYLLIFHHLFKLIRVLYNDDIPLRYYPILSKII